jgi:hypothetical protein
MKRHLTDASVQRIKPPAVGTVEIFDLGYPGLALRIGHGGAKTFELFYRVGGKLRRETLGRWPAISLADARMAWRKTREAIAKGEAPPQLGDAKTPLFETVVEEWLKRDQSKNKASSQHQLHRSLEVDLLRAALEWGITLQLSQEQRASLKGLCCQLAGGGSELP